MDTLIQADRSLFLFLNGFHSSFWDPIMIFISGKITWLPFYIVLIWYLVKERKKKVWVTLLVIALMILATDQISVMIKNSVLRLRPCQDPSMNTMLHLVRGCGGKYGFVSSHAANSFGVAIFFTLFFKHRWAGVALMFWALIVSYSRVYLGVHFPGDILGGAILGLILGTLFFLLDKYLLLKIYHKKPPLGGEVFKVRST